MKLEHNEDNVAWLADRIVDNMDLKSLCQFAKDMLIVEYTNEEDSFREGVADYFEGLTEEEANACGP